MFAWLRPNDLVWNYVVNNYLLGKTPPAFDVLYWNQDAVRLAAGLHRDFVRLALDNSLARPDALTVLGSPVDLGAVDVDSYIVAGLKDHIVPWENAYRSTQLLGGDTQVRALDERPHPGHGQPAGAGLALELPRRGRASRRPAGVPRQRGQGARAAGGRTTPPGSRERSGAMRPAPKRLGGRGHRALGKAPGTYVYAS